MLGTLAESDFLTAVAPFCWFVFVFGRSGTIGRSFRIHLHHSKLLFAIQAFVEVVNREHVAAAACVVACVVGVTAAAGTVVVCVAAGIVAGVGGIVAVAAVAAVIAVSWWHGIRFVTMRLRESRLRRGVRL